MVVMTSGDPTELDISLFAVPLQLLFEAQDPVQGRCGYILDEVDYELTYKVRRNC